MFPYIVFELYIKFVITLKMRLKELQFKNSSGFLPNLLEYYLDKNLDICKMIKAVKGVKRQKGEQTERFILIIIYYIIPLLFGKAHKNVIQPEIM